MEYKRLTTKDEEGNWQVWEDDYSHPFEALQVAIDRLAELEDKFEQGTLVDTEAYFIVEENQWAGKNRFLVCQNAIQLAVCDFCETREEAEKRLKELQG